VITTLESTKTIVTGNREMGRVLRILQRRGKFHGTEPQRFRSTPPPNLLGFLGTGAGDQDGWSSSTLPMSSGIFIPSWVLAIPRI